MNQKTISGTSWMILSVVFFSLMQLCVRLTGGEVSLFLQILVRNLFGVALALYYIRRDRLSWFGPREEQPFLFGRSIAGFLGILSFFYASRYGNLADVTIVNRTHPFFTTLFSAVFLKQSAPPRQWCALVLVFLGGVIAADPSFTTASYPLLCAFLAAFFNGIAYTLLAHFRDKVPAWTVIAHFSVFSVAASVPFLVGNFVWPSPQDLFLLVLIAVFGSGGQIAVTMAYRSAPAGEVAIYDQLSIVCSMLQGWGFLGQTPTLRTWLGGGVVIVTSLWIHRHPKTPRPEKD